MTAEHFDPGAVLARLRRTLVKRPPTQLEARDHAADWWEALHSELVCARRDTLRGVVNLRVGPEDVDHSHLMAVWMRHEARDMAWKADDANLRASEYWRANKPPDGDSAATARAWAALPDMLKARLADRPRSPDKRDPPIPLPRNYLPLGWPPIRPGLPWSVYLSGLLTEFRSRAGVVDREPGEDEPDMPANEKPEEAAQ